VFVEEFILDQTLDPAIAEFGLKDVSLIDPTCGSGHFLLGAFRRLLGGWQKQAPTENITDLARRALESPPDDQKAFSDAVRTWLLERLETTFREQSQPELRTTRQLALDLGRDPAVGAAHELLTEESGLDLVKLISDLADIEGVPSL